MSVGVGTSDSGEPLSNVDLLPGCGPYHLILSRDYCRDQPASCLAADAGLYDYESSSTIDSNVTDAPGLAFTQAADLAQKTTGNVSIVTDSLSMNTSQSQITIPNSAIDAIHEQKIRLPDGTQYAPETGFLALGNLQDVRPYPRGPGQIVTSYLAGKEVTPSASTSLHYGSAQSGPNGSLIFGGYDRNRVIGDVGRFPISEEDSLMISSILDIQIGVEIGGSPFEKDSYTGLLQKNASVGQYQPAIINPTLSYFFMASETCANIASHLPLTLDTQYGLYTWNTADPQYERIINSPAYLSFVFRSGGAGTGAAPSNITIKIPFKLLNLTLESPIASTPTPYFPCRPFTIADGSGRYFLGRAFLQGAFLAMNFNSSTFFLAQAPGPNADEPNIQPIASDDIDLGSIDAERFAASWADNWTPLAATAGRPASSQMEDNSLSGGAIAGIVVGMVVIVLLIVLGALYLIRRRRKKANAAMKDGNDDANQNFSGGSGVHEKDPTTRSFEAGGDQGIPHEAPSNMPWEADEKESLRHEAPGETPWEVDDKNILPYEQQLERFEVANDKALPELPAASSPQPQLRDSGR